MARTPNDMPETIRELAAHLSELRQQVLELARRLSSGDGGAFKTLKVQRRAVKRLEQRLRFEQKRERRLAWGV